MKNQVVKVVVTLSSILGFLLIFAAYMSDIPSFDVPDGRECCTIAIDTSRMGRLFQMVIFLIGILIAGMLGYKIWEGITGVLDKDRQRGLRWASNFLLNELLTTVHPPLDDSKKQGGTAQPHLVERDLIAPIIKLLGEFLGVAQSEDEKALEQMKGRLGDARSELERKGWRRPYHPSHTVHFLFRGSEDDRPPPEGLDWRATAKFFQSSEEAEEYCRDFAARNSNIEKVMGFDLVYCDWTFIYTREEILNKEKNPPLAE